MKTLLSLLMLVISTSYLQSQTVAGDVYNEDYTIIDNETESYDLNDNNTNYAAKYSISKFDKKTKKQTFNVFLNIPDKSKDEQCYTTGNNKISTFVVGNDIQIIYDVFDKNAELKKCYIKTLGLKGSPLSEAKLLAEAPCKSRFSIANTNFRVIYSPDKSKFAVLVDNASKGIVVEPSITIYDSKNITTLSTKKLKSLYNGTKIQIDPYTNFKIDNAGNISLNFNTYTAEKNTIIKSYEGDIPFAENDIKNIKEAGASATLDNKGYQGKFYNSLEDFANNKPMGDLRIENASYDRAFGESYKIMDKNGDVKKVKISDFPTALYTYNGDELYRAFKKEAYRFLAVGNVCLYAHLETVGNGYDKDKLYWSQGGINGEIDKFKEGGLEELLEKANLLEAYNKDKPKREAKDDVNDFYNKEVSRYIKYINILNKKK